VSPLILILILNSSHTFFLLLGGAWNKSISAICFARPLHNIYQLLNLDSSDYTIDIDKAPGSFAGFLTARCRAYLLSDKPLEWPVPGTLEYGCNTHSSGEAVNHEDSVVSAWQNMLLWLKELNDDPSHEEVEFVIEDAVIDEA
jgi:hypothetical protein